MATGAQPVDRRHQATLVGVAVAVILLAWFALANLNRVRIDFWVFHRDAPLIVVIVISGLLGALITALIMRRKPREPAVAPATVCRRRGGPAPVPGVGVGSLASGSGCARLSWARGRP